MEEVREMASVNKYTSKIQLENVREKRKNPQHEALFFFNSCVINMQCYIRFRCTIQ